MECALGRAKPRTGVVRGFVLLQLRKLRLPHGGTGVAWHAPVAAGAERDRADLRSVGQAAALELLGKEAAVEILQPVQQHIVRIAVAERVAREPVDLRRPEAEAQHVVQVKIVQLVGADERFRLLGDLAVFLCRQQLGADGGVENVEQHSTQGFVFRRVGCVAHDVAHECFRYICIHAVHAHVVAVVGGPAEGQLAQIAGADDEPARAVGEVHELERAHARLTVFIRHVKHGLVLPNVGKVAVDGARDRDLLKRHAQLLTEDLGVGARAVRCAEARHRHGQHVLRRAAELLHRAHGHEQGEAAVQPAGDADDGGLCVRMGDALGQTVRLHGKNELAALGTCGIIRRDERRRRDIPRERHLPERQVKLNRCIACIFEPERCAAAALADHASEVELRTGVPCTEGLRLREQRTVFTDEVMRGKDHVGRRLAVPGVGVEVRAQ